MSLAKNAPNKRQQIARLGGLASVPRRNNLMTQQLVMLLSGKDKKRGGKFGARVIAEALYEHAAEGKLDAISLVFDRVEGKAAQPIDHSPAEQQFASAAIQALSGLMDFITDARGDRTTIVDISAKAETEGGNSVIEGQASEIIASLPLPKAEAQRDVLESAMAQGDAARGTLALADEEKA